MYPYRESNILERIVRRTAATRPMAWLYSRIQPILDHLVYRMTNGRATASSLTSGLPIMMLTTTGAKTGQPRTVPVLGLPAGDVVILIASNYGRAQNPSWYHNLRAHPRATVRIDGVSRDFDAREISGEESERHFQRAIELYPGFEKYRSWASNRQIPVLRLDPVS